MKIKITDEIIQQLCKSWADSLQLTVRINQQRIKDDISERVSQRSVIQGCRRLYAEGRIFPATNAGRRITWRSS